MSDETPEVVAGVPTTDEAPERAPGEPRFMKKERRALAPKMVEIEHEDTKGRALVTRKAFDEVYSSNGWHLVSEEEVDPVEAREAVSSSEVSPEGGATSDDAASADPVVASGADSDSKPKGRGRFGAGS